MYWERKFGSNILHFDVTIKWLQTVCLKPPSHFLTPSGSLNQSFQSSIRRLGAPLSFVTKFTSFSFSFIITVFLSLLFFLCSISFLQTVTNTTCKLHIVNLLPVLSVWQFAAWLCVDCRMCSCIFSDIDECLKFRSPCSHGCENTPGSFTCTCPDGYFVLPNGRCKGWS